ncbi:hypothetical protein GE09DRAFT_1066650 [Coniochaeta sp. 2T2.1]|nr:hypothetical protein GE09DRAFT_1066650 [Coniochaeta sp. 2T2.1]
MPQAHIAATVSAGTAEAIRERLSKEGLGLDVTLSAPFWRADKVFVRCGVEIPPSLEETSFRIFSAVMSVANVCRKNPPRMRPSEEEADDDDDEDGEKHWESEEGDVNEGSDEQADGLGIWDT